MNLKKDADGRRWIEVAVEVPGTPEQVWQAIATGPGVSSWFVPTEVRDDGTIVSRFGPGMDSVKVRTTSDPPHRFVGEGTMGPGGPNMATEWTVEARAGGTCIVRVVHSLFASTDDWDDQLESIASGWPDFFRVLSLYLTHFAGWPSSGLQFLAMAKEPAARSWETLTSALALGGARVGERFTTPATAPPLAGLIEAPGNGGGHAYQMVLRLDQPTAGLVNMHARTYGDQTMVAIHVYLYGDGAAAAVARDEPVWRAWISERFALMG
jgi:uncharacterized protein YndB with AHSA1/START domain